MTPHRRLWISASIIALVIIVSFALSVPRTRDVSESLERTAESAPASGITLKDSFRRGTHTISGTVVVPDACSMPEAEAMLSGDAEAPEGIVVALSLPADAGICLQLPTERTFSVTINAPEGLPVTATINGIAASTTAL